MTTKASSAPRCVALVGSYLSGKTSLLESLIAATGSLGRKGTAKEGNTVGDGAPESRARHMSAELNAVTTEYLGEEWTFIDCPGSVELRQDALNALMVVDAAIVVCEPETERALTVVPILKFLSDRDIPHVIFINKMDTATTGVRAIMEALQGASPKPLALREVPIRDDETVTGHVDLISERAFQWNPNKPSDLVEIPEELRDREQQARTELLETVADFDDNLLEALLEDIVPQADEIYTKMAKVLGEASLVPVFFGSAEQDNGIIRLMKALRHETPEPGQTAERLGIDVSGGDVQAQVFKTVHAGHTGKLSYCRVWSGEVTEGMTLNGDRISGLYKPYGQKQDKRAKAGPGVVAALGRMEGVATGDLLTPAGGAVPDDWPEPLKALYSLAIFTEHRGDEVKLSGALSKVIEEDPSLSYEQRQDTGELVLWGLGETHLQIAIDRLRNRYNLEVSSRKPQVPYQETIRKPTSQHARHKKQSGGHGQFGDVHVDIKPLPRGSGFTFANTISGGVVPKQYIPAVESGVRDYLVRGPLGFPVVDLSVTLTDGQFHAVDSSDMAFKTAGALAMREGMPKCVPVLLEPVCQVVILLPNEFTSRIQRVVSGRRGQILGFGAKPDWDGWDEVSVQMPQSEMHDLINELRSITLGVGTFEWSFDHLQEITGRVADQVVAERAAD